VNGSWNFGQRQFFNTRISPYLTIGAGGLTAEIKDAASTYIRSDGVKFADGTFVPSGRSILLNDGDTFLTDGPSRRYQRADTSEFLWSNANLA